MNNKQLNIISLICGILFLILGLFISDGYEILTVYKIVIIYSLLISVSLAFVTNSKYNETGLVIISIIPVLNMVFILFGAKLVLIELLHIKES